MNILLVQHGESKSKEQDPARSLSEDGFRNTEKIADWIGKHSFSVKEILHSGKKRAQETAMIFADHLQPEQGVHAVEGLNPNDQVLPFAEMLGEREETIMVVGHLPFLGKLCGLLLAGDQERNMVSFINSGVVCLKKEKYEWSVAWYVIPDLLST